MRRNEHIVCVFPQNRQIHSNNQPPTIEIHWKLFQRKFAKRKNCRNGESANTRIVRNLCFWRKHLSPANTFSPFHPTFVRFIFWSMALIIDAFRTGDDLAARIVRKEMANKVYLFNFSIELPFAIPKIWSFDGKLSNRMRAQRTHANRSIRISTLTKCSIGRHRRCHCAAMPSTRCNLAKLFYFLLNNSRFLSLTNEKIEKFLIKFAVFFFLSLVALWFNTFFLLLDLWSLLLAAATSNHRPL